MNEKLYTMPVFEIYYIMGYSKIIIFFYQGSNIIIMRILLTVELKIIFSFSFHSFAFLSILCNFKVYI